MGFRISAIALGLCPLFLLLHFTPTRAAIQCYQFTWPGEANDTDCDDHKIDTLNAPIPCKYPMVFTVPRHLPPDLNDLNDHCSKTTCPKYKCSVENQVCIQWSWYDVQGNIYNYTTFCGTVADATNMESKGAVPVNNGCWEQRMGTFTRKVCACDSENLCNGSSSLMSSLLLVTLFLLAVHFLNRNFTS
ncbi:uncharacterized protein LOC135203573 [Macrobrachium nipponense]|uniref:uncharacterized protein LOC135203573 n=1 Tax=Macrobrachium nipponense TaxID=159736 RepID=UPI0030C87809